MSSTSARTAAAGPTAMHRTTVREAMDPGIMACTVGRARRTRAKVLSRSALTEPSEAGAS